MKVTCWDKYRWFKDRYDNRDEEKKAERWKKEDRWEYQTDVTDTERYRNR